MKVEKIIAANLAYYMTVKRENQVELARALKVTPGTVSCYMTGKCKPRLSLLMAIALHYGCTLDDLVTLKIHLDTCPFCGAEAKIVSTDNGCKIQVDHEEGCYLDMISVLNAEFEDAQEAANAWNRRA